ncbi:MAG: TIGR03936 family radical SAM-associated protein [Armatimonadota bacterium]|nr:TIGR03936 family radical SAM-associated protein [Armatimonadota bacterium]
MNTHAQRVALTYTKTGAARWLSHLDLIRTLEMAIRRAKAPIAYSQGFNPRPRLSFGPPLPLGATSSAELAALKLDSPADPRQLLDCLNAQLPAGIQITDARVVPESDPTLPAIRGSSYLVRVLCRAADPAHALQKALGDFLAHNEVIAERIDKRVMKRVDIRAGVESLEIVEVNENIAVLRMRISHAGRQITRPSEVVQAISRSMAIEMLSIHREFFY